MGQTNAQRDAKLAKDAAAAGLSVEDFKAQLAAQDAAQAAANTGLSDAERQAAADREKAAAAAAEDAAGLREQLAAAEEREAKAAAKVADLEAQLSGATRVAGVAAGGTVTNNAKGEIVTE